MPRARFFSAGGTDRTRPSRFGGGGGGANRGNYGGGGGGGGANRPAAAARPAARPAGGGGGYDEGAPEPDFDNFGGNPGDDDIPF